MISNIRIKKEQIEFLIKNIKNVILKEKLEKLKENPIYKDKYKTNQYTLIISDFEKELFLDELTMIMSLNLKENGDLNKNGIIIDSIIDVFLNNPSTQ